ncbi:hypothetical protein DASC09_006890 [Saccharomycopsis crataegensis]|uniref:F-box domain-containing protein n=1 Tax=Saccharomycopsis crataegensis TaxID=43959 RepID=A0AAV5QFB8_9ASCO|nr:hypothetical protein DASC09_006890 [Saccharomycopsis crataegensis]
MAQSGVSIAQLPQDVWNEIFQFVCPATMCCLRLVSKEFDLVVKTSRIWRQWSVARWFTIHDIDKRALTGVDDFFYYYTHRRTKERRFLSDLTHSINNLNIDATFDQLWRILEDENIYDMIPLLFNLSRASPTGLEGFPRKHIILNLLRSLRSNVGFQFIHHHTLQHDNTMTIPLEECFFKLSYFDPCFDVLLPYRNLVIDEVLRLYHDIVDNATMPYSHTHSVVLLGTLLFKVKEKNYTSKLSANHLKVIVQPSPPSLEDNFLLRVYSGETRGSTILLNSIVARLANKLGIPCHVSRTVIVVNDSMAENGRSMVFVNKRNVQVFTNAQIAQHVRHHGTHRTRRIRGMRMVGGGGASMVESLVKEYLAPLSVQDVLSYVFDFKFPSVTELSSLANRRDDVRVREMYETLFPISGSEVSRDRFEYISAYYKLMVVAKETSTSTSTSRNDPLSASESLERVRAHEKLVDDLKFSYFTDLPFIKRYWPLEIDPHQQEYFQRFAEQLKQEYCDLFLKHFNIHPDTGGYPKSRRFQVGDVVYHQRWSTYGIVVGWKAVPNYSAVLDGTGETTYTVFYNVYSSGGASFVGSMGNDGGGIGGSVSVYAQAGLVGRRGRGNENDYDGVVEGIGELYFVGSGDDDDEEEEEEDGLVGSMILPEIDGSIIKDLCSHESIGLFFERYDDTSGRFIATKLLKKLYPNL